MRFSIAWMMGFVVIAALAFAGLRGSNPFWASACYSLAFVSIISSALMAIYTRGRERAYCVGHTVAGSSYFLIVFVLAARSTPNFETPVFLTTALLEYAQTFSFSQHPNPGVVPSTPQSTMTLPLVPAVPQMPLVTSDSMGGVGVPALLPPPASQITTTPPLAENPDSTLRGSTRSSAPSGAVMNANPNGKISETPFRYSPSLSLQPGVSISSSGDEAFVREIYFNQIGQGIATLLFAYIGGLFSLFLANRRERSESNSPAEISPSSP
jgi:hypothetical protein